MNGWIPDIIIKNLILIHRDGENILYWIGKSPFYHHVYNGKYFPLNLYYNKKISDIERDIFFCGKTKIQNFIHMIIYILM
nr:hypothetical protein [Mesomycoplasma hyopneumoniae]